VFNFTAPPPLSLYIHIPWCMRKCPYCDFNSHAVRAAIPEAAYTDALIADLEQDLPRVRDRSVETVFIGGGTPSLFSPGSIKRLLAAVRERLPLAPGAEITLEANPGTADTARLAGFREAGINRLSLGIQSFDSGLLERIGRIHDGARAHAAVTDARTAGFDNLNLDLMFGLPGQDSTRALTDLQTAIDHAPEHLSRYELTIEPNTRFGLHPPRRPDADRCWEMQQAGETVLAQAGYARYEVSAFARRGYQCRHNRNYWEFGDYLGIGAGAHGKLTDAAGQTITRLSKPRHPRRYLEVAGSARGIDTCRSLSEDDALLEYGMNALRLTNGFRMEDFTRATGLPLQRIEPAVQDATDRGLLTAADGRIQATEHGRRFLDELLLNWLPEPARRARNG